MTETKTIKIYKDKKHSLKYGYGVENIDYLYVCGPLTNNLWYKVIADEGKYLIAEVAEL